MICLISCLSLSSKEWSSALLLASAGQHADAEEIQPCALWWTSLMFLTLASLLQSRASWQPWPGFYLSHLCEGVRMSQGIISQGHSPDMSLLECIWRSSQTALGSFYPQTLHRAVSWLMAKWRIKHSCVEDQKGTGREEFKCMCLLEEHYPYQHCGFPVQHPSPLFLYACKDNHLHVDSLIDKSY